MKELTYYPVHKVYTNNKDKGLDTPNIGDKIYIQGTNEIITYTEETNMNKYDK